MVFVCFSVFFLSVTFRSAGALFVRRGHSVNKYCVTVYGSILIKFSPFSSEVMFLSDTLESSHYRCQVAPQVLSNCGRKCETPKIGGKRMCAPLRIDS